MFFFFKQKTAYEMRISDWSSDVCSSDLVTPSLLLQRGEHLGPELHPWQNSHSGSESLLRPVIGVVLSPDEVAGVRISGMTPNGGGAKAGLQPGDRIVTIK